MLAPAALGASHSAASRAGEYHCGFERSWSECGFTAQAKAADRVTLVMRSGVPAGRLRTERGDEAIAGSGNAERADLALTTEATDCAEGKASSWGRSLLCP